MDPEAGTRLARCRLSEGIEGVRRLHQLVAELVADPGEVVVGIETDRGLWVEALVGLRLSGLCHQPDGGGPVPGPPPCRGSQVGPRADAKVLADVVRTDRHNHRPVAGDSPDAEAVKLLARAHQSLIWARTRHSNQLRERVTPLLPGGVGRLRRSGWWRTRRRCWTRRPPLPGPVPASRWPRYGRCCPGGEAAKGTWKRRAWEISEVFRPPPSSPPPTRWWRRSPRSPKSTVAVIAELNRQIRELEAGLEDRFRQHPDAAIILSLPGLGDILGARVLGEFGDHRRLVTPMPNSQGTTTRHLPSSPSHPGRNEPW